VLSKESLLLAIHPYVLDNFMIHIDMTPEWEGNRYRTILPGDATPEYLLESAKITSDYYMNESYKYVQKQVFWWRKNEAAGKAQGDAGLHQAIADFENKKVKAIGVHNDIAYTASVLSLDPLKWC